MSERARIVVSILFTGIIVAIATDQLPRSFFTQDAWATCLARVIVSGVIYETIYFAIGRERSKS